MMLYPDVQERAQAEIDSVIGGDRFPSLSDRPSLPYIDAITKEVLRWNSVFPLGARNQMVLMTSHPLHTELIKLT